MKSTRSIWLVGFTVVCLVTPAFAGGSRLGGEIGLGTANDNVDDGLSLNGFLELDIQDDIAVRGGISYFGGDATVDVLSEGEVTMFGIEAATMYRIKAEKARPYIGAGIGYYMPEHELSGDAEAFAASLGLRVKEDLDSGVGFFFMGGVTVPMGEAALFGASAKYLILEVDDDAKVTELATFRTATNTGEVDLNTLFLSLSFQLQF